MRVLYFGHVGQRTGYGRAAEATCLAMIAAGIELEVRPLAPRDQLDLTRAEVLPVARRIREDGDFAPAGVVFVHTLPLDCRQVLEHVDVPGAIFKSRMETYPRLCAYTTWEGASDITAEIRLALQDFHHVFWPSSHNLQRAIGIGQRSILPHAYDAFAPRPQCTRAKPPSPENPYRFYYVGAWNLRKNPVGLIRAFISEFGPAEDVELVLQCSGNVTHTEFLVALASTGVAREKMPRITFWNRFLSDTGLEALHTGADCFVTATRGEAWNLPAFDALLYRRHVIAPMRMGHDDFLAGTSVGWIGGCSQPAMGDVIMADRRAEAPNELHLQYVGAQGLDGRGLWRDPDLKGLASQMRDAFAHNISVLRVPHDPAERYSYEVVGKQLRATLEAL